MKASLIAAAVWTVLVLGIVLFVPNEPRLLSCMRFVGRSAACEADQESINIAYQAYQTIPALFAIVAGYVAIVVVWIVGMRRRGRSR